ncbi:hypothetical protein T08_9237, partial [Trichinella sp. T8]
MVTYLTAWKNRQRDLAVIMGIRGTWNRSRRRNRPIGCRGTGKVRARAIVRRRTISTATPVASRSAFATEQFPADKALLACRRTEADAMTVETGPEGTETCLTSPFTKPADSLPSVQKFPCGAASRHPEDVYSGVDCGAGALLAINTVQVHANGIMMLHCAPPRIFWRTRESPVDGQLLGTPRPLDEGIAAEDSQEEACLTFVGDESHDRHPLSLLQLLTCRNYVDFPTVEVSYPEWQSSGRGPQQWNQRWRYRQRPAVLSSRHTISWCHGVAVQRTAVRKTMI